MPLSFVWQAVYWTWAVSEVAILMATRTRRSTGETLDRGSLWVLWVVIFSSISAGSWIGATQPHTLFPDAVWVGPLSLALLIAGIAVRWTAILSLGRAFSVNVAIRAAQTLHTTGMFRYIRHPSYTGMLIIFAAIGLGTQNWLGVAILLLPPFAAILYRIHVEEKALRWGFGDAYVRYSQTTKRLLPGIY